MEKNMKALILSVADKRHMAMISPYIDYFINNNIDYDIIRANRYDDTTRDIQVTNEIHGDVYEIKMVFRPGINKIRKIIPFMRFRFEAQKIMESKFYDYIVVWNENTAALFSDVLIKRFSGRCCINIRDYYPGYLKNRIIHAGEKANFVTVVSPESREFSHYPKEKVLCLYNQDMNLKKRWKERPSFRSSDLPIRVTHMGAYSKAQSSDIILQLFANDDRFLLQFYGDGFEREFKEKVEKIGARNVHVGGAFPYEKTLDYLYETDIINSYYNYTTDPEYHAAFGIKHSYTPMLCIPSLADEDTFWGKMSKPYGVAYLVNNKNINTLPDDLYRWYRNLDFETFNKGCKELFGIMRQSRDEIYNRLDSILKR